MIGVAFLVLLLIVHVTLLAVIPMFRGMMWLFCVPLGTPLAYAAERLYWYLNPHHRPTNVTLRYRWRHVYRREWRRLVQPVDRAYDYIESGYLAPIPPSELR